MKLIRQLFIFPIKFYQYIISPLLPRRCRFTPTCSHYALEALEKHGILKGILLSSLRILKCNPFGSYGYDPVPIKPQLVRKNKNEQ